MVGAPQLPFSLLDWRARAPGWLAAVRARPDVTVHARSVFLQVGLPKAESETAKPQTPKRKAPAPKAPAPMPVTAFIRNPLGIEDWKVFLGANG